MLAVAALEVDYRDPLRLGPRPDPARPPTGNAHQVVRVKFLVGAVLCAPPGPEPTRAGAGGEIDVEHEVHAVVAAGHGIVVLGGEFVGHPPIGMSIDLSDSCPAASSPSEGLETE